MVKINKENALFVKGVVIANGIEDSDGDVLNKEEIKRLISSFLSHQTDTNHDFLQNMGVKIIENYISQTEEKISGRNIPIGSWIATLMIWEKDLMSLIRQGRLNGLSLASQPDPDLKANFTNLLNKRKTYSDCKNLDKLTPTFISIVNNPANGIPFEFFSYETYITKSKGTEANKVSEETQELSKIATSLIEVLGSQLNGSQTQTSEPILKAAPPQGGVAPTMQPPAQNPYAAPTMQVPTMQSIDQKLDQLIQIMSGSQQIQKSEKTDEKEEKKETPKEDPKPAEKKETKETTAAEEKGETEGEGAKAGDGGEGSVQKEEKTHDETGQPQTKEGGASLNQTAPTANNNVQPSSKIEGQNPAGVARQVIKSAPSQTENATVSEPVMQSYADQSIGTVRDPLGRPIRD